MFHWANEIFAFDNSNHIMQFGFFHRPILQDFPDGGYEMELLLFVITTNGGYTNMPSFCSSSDFSGDTNEQLEAIEFAEFRIGEFGYLRYLIEQSLFV